MVRRRARFLMLVDKEYECDKCGVFSILQEHNQISKKCPKCKSKNFERRISSPAVSKLNDPRTIGSLIDRNNKRNPLSREKAFGVDAEKKLAAKDKFEKINRMSPEQKQKWIETGKGL